LARDILNWIRRQRLELFERLTYWIIEPSERRHHWQEQTLAGFAPKVRWAKALSEMEMPLPAHGPRHPSPFTRPISGVRQIVFGNELLDAFPAHRLGWDAKGQRWFEWGVTLREGRFDWARLNGDASDLVLRSLPVQPISQVSSVLPDGFIVEVCPAAEDWWRRAASVLACGKLLTIDYGLAAEDLLAPERTGGTLRAYYRHHLSGDVLAHPGEQDITAHVNFSAIQAAGESAGLRTEAFLTQEQFLTRVAERVWKADASFGDWTAQHTRQFQTLTHPEHLGRAFRFLVQGRCRTRTTQ
jgi:SAM-dependent MidA family methyltransferase